MNYPYWVYQLTLPSPAGRILLQLNLHEVPDEILSNKLDNFPLVSTTRRLAFVADACLGLFLNVAEPLLLWQVPKEGLVDL